MVSFMRLLDFWFNSMSKHVNISKICIEIGDKKVELSLDQAKELKDILMKLKVKLPLNL